MNEARALKALRASPDLQELVGTLLERIDSLEAEATAKGRAPARTPTVKDAIAATIQKDLHARRSSQVRKSGTTELSDHFLSDKIAKRKADERAELQRIADEGARTTVEALRKKAGL